ncbi:MAG: ATPase, T2SS/T4P/T4SS family, partial [Proteobacteria bacterium]|nr:ATPase, T2SS/T4P/T4SS family [Pseudomonadota bacterium]
MTDSTDSKKLEDQSSKIAPKWTQLPSVDFRSLQHKTLGQILVEAKSISEKQLADALREQKEAGNSMKLGEVLVANNFVSEDDMLRALALQLDLPYYDRLPINDIDPMLVDNIPIQFCRDNKILPIARDDFNVTVVVADPLNVYPLDDLRLFLLVRFRIDGVLQDKTQVQKRHSGSMASRIKVIGKLDIAEKRIPQDGRISIKVAGKDIDVRLSVIPVAFGERIVMRLLDKSSGGKRLDQSGLEKHTYESLCSLIEQKHGIVLVTGPTGSGKSTLLYACLMHINTSDINILTIEDPVEYQVSGVGQIEVKDKIGMTFASGLRAILRQDPDVIMIGEIRDAETARIAVQASITGHLVLSTLHTNDTASTVTRFLDFGVQPFQLSSAVLGIVATRLLRRLCPNCREPYDPSDIELQQIGIKRTELRDRQVYRAGRGCDRCFGNGYHGRIGVYELMVFDEEMRNFIMATQDAKAIKKKAVEKG